MRNPRVFLDYAPRAGLRCALAYIAGDRDVYGWFIGPGDDAALESAYFVLEDFYTPLETRYIEVADADLHTRWTRDEAMCHELAQLQEAFTHEWLCHGGDSRAAAERDRYARAELAAGEVNVRFQQLNRFSKLQADWTHYSHDFEHGVLECLGRHWPLDYAIVQEPWKAAHALTAVKGGASWRGRVDGSTSTRSAPCSRPS